MNISIIDAFNKTLTHHKIDLNSPYKKSEANFCISKMFDLIDMSKLNIYESKLYVEKVESFVFKKFNLI